MRFLKMLHFLLVAKDAPGTRLGYNIFRAKCDIEEKFPVLTKLFPVSCYESFLVALFF